jgi:hypothetical protein
LNLPPADQYNPGEYAVTSGENLDAMALYKCKCCDKYGKHYWEKVDEENIEEGKYIVAGPYKRYFFEYVDGMWNDWGTSDEIWRDAIFSPRTIVKRAENVRSNQKLNNIPVAYIVLNWPANTTRYLFGRP